MGYPMSHRLRIGNAAPDPDYADLTIRFCCEDLDDWPDEIPESLRLSYWPTRWGAFRLLCEVAKIWPMFSSEPYATTGGWTGPSGQTHPVLLRRSGCSPLTEDHAQAFEAAYFRAQGVDDWPDDAALAGTRLPIPSKDEAVHALHWLWLWTRWAVGNCEHPAFFME